MQLKFFLVENPLIKQEENREHYLRAAEIEEREQTGRPGNHVPHAQYTAELAFANIKQFQYSLVNDRSDDDDYSLHVLVKVRNPVCVRKNYNK